MTVFTFRKSLSPLTGLGDKVSFEQRLVETIAWCESRASIDDPAGSLRTDELRPRILERNRAACVSSLASVRAGRTQSQLDAVRGLGGGGLLAYFPDAELSDGAAQEETRGYFDINNAPPWDTWLALLADGGPSDSAYGEYLVAWVPPAFVPLAQSGISVCMEDSIVWLDKLNTPASQRIRQLVSAHAG
jgi:hypothetical protein